MKSKILFIAITILIILSNCLCDHDTQDQIDKCNKKCQPLILINLAQKTPSGYMDWLICINTCGGGQF